MKKIISKLLLCLIFIFVGIIIGYNLKRPPERSVKQDNQDEIPFDKGELYELLVAVKKDEKKYCGECTRSVNYVQAMNDKFAFVKAMGIDGPGAYFIYEKTDEVMPKNIQETMVAKIRGEE